jgi:glycosyltransferase involved in cell wall biosynthesis
MPLVIVGDSPYDAEYMVRLRKLANERVLFIGRINNQATLNGLYQGAYLYIHGHEVGGTNPSLLRAMQAATAPAVIDVPFNTSVVGNDGFIFDKGPGNFSSLLQRLVEEPDKIKKIGLNAKACIEKNFRWEDVVNRHKLLFEKVTFG